MLSMLLIVYLMRCIGKFILLFFGKMDNIKKIVIAVDEAIAQSDKIIEQAISDGIIKRSSSVIELSSQERLRRYFEENNIK